MITDLPSWSCGFDSRRPLLPSPAPEPRHVARSTEKPQARHYFCEALIGPHDPDRLLRALWLPDRRELVPFHWAETNASPIADAITSSRSLVAC